MQMFAAKRHIWFLVDVIDIIYLPELAWVKPESCIFCPIWFHSPGKLFLVKVILEDSVQEYHGILRIDECAFKVHKDYSELGEQM